MKITKPSRVAKAGYLNIKIFRVLSSAFLVVYTAFQHFNRAIERAWRPVKGKILGASVTRAFFEIVDFF